MRIASASNALARRGARRGTRGQGLVELAFLLPIVVMLWSAFIDFGRINLKKQQVFAALDAVSQMIANQPINLTAEELEDMGCQVLEDTGALKDLGRAKADCLAGAYVDVRAEQADPSTDGQTMFPIVVTMDVPAFLPVKLRLPGGTNYNALSTYTVTTGVHYVRPARVGNYQ